MVVSMTDLRRLPGLGALPRDALAALAVTGVPGAYRRDDEVFRAGEPCHGLAIVRSGYVRLYRRCPSGREGTVGIVRHGGFLGIAALRGQAVHDHSAQCLSAVQTLLLPDEALRGAHARFPSILSLLVVAVAARGEGALADLAADAQVPIDQRVLRVLRRLTDSPAQPGPCGLDRLALRLSHGDLARLVGAERANVTRALRDLERAGLVARDHGHVVGVAAPATGTA